MKSQGRKWLYPAGVAVCAFIALVVVHASFSKDIEPASTNERDSAMIANTENTYEGLQKATFGAGCFWHVEDAFRQVKGVVSTEVGYAGGHVPQPKYQRVCAGDTGHAEVVQLIYDPRVISYDELLNIFWRIHDPTTANRQGLDVGSQYRSVIFYHTPAQRAQAVAVKEKLSHQNTFSRPIVTTIEPAKEFYRAEEYHQHYYLKMGKKGVCYFRKN